MSKKDPEFEELLNNIYEGFLSIGTPKNNGIILVGATKEGKSTLICYMKGMKLVVFKNNFGEVRIKKEELSLEM